MDIYTDGSCRKNKVGAFGFVVVVGGKVFLSFGKREEATTNNIMELKGVLAALNYIKKTKYANVSIYCDSEYVVKGYNRWIHAWKANNWIGSTKKPVANRQIWEQLDSVRTELEAEAIEPNLSWVRGHDGTEFNEYVDNVVQTISAY